MFREIISYSIVKVQDFLFLQNYLLRVIHVPGLKIHRQLLEQSQALLKN